MPLDSADSPELPPEGVVENLLQRVTSLEELLTHSQHTIEVLSQEMFAQTRRVEALQQELARLMHKLNLLSDGLPSSPRDPVAEKPPHY